MHDPLKKQVLFVIVAQGFTCDSVRVRSVLVASRGPRKLCLVGASRIWNDKRPSTPESSQTPGLSMGSRLFSPNPIRMPSITRRSLVGREIFRQLSLGPLSVANFRVAIRPKLISGPKSVCRYPSTGWFLTARILLGVPTNMRGDSDRRAIIVMVGIAVLREHGFAGFSQLRVAIRAGVRQSHLTYYFPTRAEKAVARVAVHRQLHAVDSMLCRKKGT
jgi:hypothetical protein